MDNPLDVEELLAWWKSQVIAFIEKHTLHGAEIGRVHRVDRWNLPPAAIREAVINSVVHADYSQRGAPFRVAIFDDRIEIENPGLLPFGLTLDDLPHGVSRLRNRVLGRVFDFGPRSQDRAHDAGNADTPRRTG